MLIDTLREQLKTIKSSIKFIKDYWENSKKELKLKNLNNLINKENFWQNKTQAKILKNFKNLKQEKMTLYSIINRYEDLNDLLELFHDDEKEIDILKRDIYKLTKELKQFKVNILLSKPNDNLNCFLNINAGAGGTESQDWASMLLRMYTKFCERQNIKYQLIDYQQAEEAGIKSATLFITTKNAYGLFKSEHGIHRLVRISPFDANKRRHTSFSAVTILPELSDTDISIDLKDIRIDTYRASGAGGQHVNKTDSAVRITHMPSKIVVQCQSERSQLQNKETAFKMLKSKLIAQKEEQKNKEMQSIEKKKIEWGSQIRSYVLQPYQLVKDYRTNYESYQPYDILEGDLINLIESYLIKI